MNNHESVKRAAEIFAEHGRTIFGIIRSQLNNDSEAEDIYQDFFLSLVRKPIPPHIQDIRGYLYRAVKNDVFDAARKAKAYKGRVRRYAERHKNEWLQQVGPDDDLIKHEQIQRVFNLIEIRLCPREAQAIICRYSRERNTGEAAQEMGVNKRTLSRYVCVGLKKIRCLIQEEQALQRWG